MLELVRYKEITTRCQLQWSFYGRAQNIRQINRRCINEGSENKIKPETKDITSIKLTDLPIYY